MEQKTYETFIKNLLKKDSFSGIIGQNDVKRQLKSAVLMKRNILIIGPPGVGKTTLAKNVSFLLPDIKAMDCGFNCTKENPLCPDCLSGNTKNEILVKGEDRFVRVQGSPDLTVEDLLGDIDPVKALELGTRSLEAFKPGKIFKANNGILFFDEVNRAPERVQNALLQVLAEKKATLSNYEIDFPANLILIATMNPEDSSTEPLSDVFLDRFDVVFMSYPNSKDEERTILLDNSKKINEVDFPDDLTEVLVSFIRELRDHPDLEKKPSVRATIGLYERMYSTALINGSKKVTINDLYSNLVSVLSHRIRLKPSKRYTSNIEDFIKKEFNVFLDRKRISMPKEVDDVP